MTMRRHLNLKKFSTSDKSCYTSMKSKKKTDTHFSSLNESMTSLAQAAK